MTGSYLALSRDAAAAGAGMLWRGMREIRAHCGIIAQHEGARALFLPATGPACGAARLRIYTVANALRGQGLATITVPPALDLAARRRLIAAMRPDVIVMQGVRHPLNRPGLYPGQPILLDIDDADFHIPRFAPHLRDAMPRLTGVIAGSRYIADWCEDAGAPETQVIWTASEISAGPRRAQIDRAPVVAWAQTRPMKYAAEADVVRQAMVHLGQRHPGTTLRLFDRRDGDDPGFAESFETPGITVEWLPRMEYAAYLGAHDDLALGLAPLAAENPFSRGKSFGKILACLDRKVPVIAGNLSEPARWFTPETGILADDPRTIARAAAGLLGDPARRQVLADAAFEQFTRDLTPRASVTRIAALLSRHIHYSRAPRVKRWRRARIWG